MSGAGVTPDIMSIAKGIGGGFPMGACLATAKAAKGMTVGTHGTTFGGNPLAMAVGNAVLDVVLAPGFLDHVQRIGPLPEAAPGASSRTGTRRSSPRSAAQGLMMGLRTHVPNTEFVAAAREQKLIVIGGRRQCGAPPAAAHRRRGRRRRSRGPARGRLHRARSRASRPRPARGSRMSRPATRHFLDLCDFSGAELRRVLDASGRHQGAKRRKGEIAAERPLAGKVLAMVFDKPSTRTRVSFDVGMRELGGETLDADGQGDAARPRRDDRRHGAGAVALCRCDHDPHARPRDGERACPTRHRAGDQRPDQARRIPARSWPMS